MNRFAPQLACRSLARRRNLEFTRIKSNILAARPPCIFLHRASLSTSHPPPEPKPSSPLSVKENIYTIPNLLTASRLVACPILGWAVVRGHFPLATSILVYAGLTDLADGYLARRFKSQTVLGTILDPAADKALVTTLAVTLTVKGMLPLPLAVIILGRDVLLSLSAFWIRYTSLPPPRTFARYWDFSLPSVEVRPTYISKVNTALQLLLMGVTTVSPLVPMDISVPLQGLQSTDCGHHHNLERALLRLFEKRVPSHRTKTVISNRKLSLVQ
ncbi:unnamed protein product [Mycena citricolor]|uniref:Phosphatidyl synthase n=1 Tax=Mycena citricolor TaxID=2018698 RepID=A0AAD2HVZ4_9AGAR|nr:unnamed protein product [Mycena citricolor]